MLWPLTFPVISQLLLSSTNMSPFCTMLDFSQRSIVTVTSCVDKKKNLTCTRAILANIHNTGDVFFTSTRKIMKFTSQTVVYTVYSWVNWNTTRTNGVVLSKNCGLGSHYVVKESKNMHLLTSHHQHPGDPGWRLCDRSLLSSQSERYLSRCFCECFRTVCACQRRLAMWYREKCWAKAQSEVFNFFTWRNVEKKKKET